MPLLQRTQQAIDCKLFHQLDSDLQADLDQVADLGQAREKEAPLVQQVPVVLVVKSSLLESYQVTEVLFGGHSLVD
jgi:hypothetical protein